jgi:hypothetical protein
MSRHGAQKREKTGLKDTLADTEYPPDDSKHRCSKAVSLR